MRNFIYIIILIAAIPFSLYSLENPPVRHSLEIVQNDGEQLRIQVGKLHLSQSDYLMSVQFNGFPHSIHNVHEGEIITFDIEKTGVYTFIFHRLQGFDNLLTKFWSIWE